MDTTEFWASQFSSFTPYSVALCLGLAVLTGIVISLVYKITYRGVLYSPQFSVVLIMLCLVTAPVVMAIGSNVALSMGMVGALSIVRFRTAIKEPLDTCYMFWSITMGILLGAKQYLIALVVVVAIGVIMILLSFFRFRSRHPYLLVVHYDPDAEKDVKDELRHGTRAWSMRSKTASRNGVEMTAEVQLDDRYNLVAILLENPRVHDATLVSCKNETGA